MVVGDDISNQDIILKKSKAKGKSKKKLKKLLEQLFNAKVSRSTSPYFACIDGTKFYDLENTMKYLRELRKLIKKILKW